MGNDVGESIWDEHPEYKKLEAKAKKDNARGLKAANATKIDSGAARRKANTAAIGKVSKMSTSGSGLLARTKTPQAPKLPRATGGIAGIAGRYINKLYK